MTQLVIMKTAGKLRLLQMGRDVFVWHLLLPLLEQVEFLKKVLVVAFPSIKVHLSVPHLRSMLALRQ